MIIILTCSLKIVGNRSVLTPYSTRMQKSHVYFWRTRFDSARFWQSPQGLKVCAPELFLLLCTLCVNSFLHTWQTTKRHCKHSHWCRSSLVSGSCFQCRLSIASVQCLRLQTFAPPSPALRHILHVLHCVRVHGGLQQSLHSVRWEAFPLLSHMDIEYSP